MTDGFVWFDNEGRLLLCNQKFRDLYPKLAGALKAGASYLELMKLAFDRDQFTVLASDERTIRARPASDPFPKRSEEHTSELQSLMRISYAVFCLKKKKKK